MFLENEHQPIMSHAPYDLARPVVDDRAHHNHHHHHLHANHHATAAAAAVAAAAANNHLQPAAGDHLHQLDDSEGRSSASSPVSSYRDLSGCEDFDARMPVPSSGVGGGDGVADGTGSVCGSGGNNNNNNNKEQKPKKHKCKHCGLECTEKVQYWKHIRTHIKPEQLLECPNCEFATDLKHHYEYHLLNHTGAKPFTCSVCDYRCVSKSMLQSHSKSHSNVFQFQCSDCGYASKYMHSLKQHLKKRDHRPATPLNPDGTPNPDIVIDVVGNRRGPRQNKKQSRHNPYHGHHHHHQHHQQQPMAAVSSTSSSQQDDGAGSGGHPSPYSMQQLLQLQPLPGVVSSPAAYSTPAEFWNSMISKRTIEMVDYHQAEYLAIKNNNNNNNNNSMSVDDKMDAHDAGRHHQRHHQSNRHHGYHPEDVVKVEVGGDRTPEPPTVPEPPIAAVVAVSQQQQAAAAAADTGPLNLSKDSVAPRAAGSSRRKGIACKLERPAAEPAKVVTAAAVDEPMVVCKEEQQPPQQQQQRSPSPDRAFQQQRHHQHHRSASSSPDKDEDATHACHHCDIIFKENIMYSMHMGFHSFRNPFACNLCGEIMNDKFSFFAHIARVPHS